MSCSFCDAPVYDVHIHPKMCLRHYEAALLKSRLERQGRPVNASNARALMQRSQVPWTIQVEELEELLKEISS